jgi:hypothetical protein
MESPAELDVAAAWAAWQEAKLPERLPELAQQAQLMLQRMEEARERRKALSTETKRFRDDMTDGVPEPLLVKFSALVQSCVVGGARSPRGCVRAVDAECGECGCCMWLWTCRPPPD